MKSIRLIPVVIFAALALLFFKGVELVTNGSYVLTGPALVQAAGEPGEASETQLADTAPTLGDTAPTLLTRAEASAENRSSSAAAQSDSAQPMSSAEAELAAACDAAASSSAPATGDLADRLGNAMLMGCPSTEPAVDAHGDAIPTIRDGTGKMVPLVAAEGDNSAAALTERLSERRTDLDLRETEIDMRTTLLEAAEKRLEERTRALAALEAQVAALVDQKQAEEEASFKAVVSMYEAMKPRDAAKIFDTLSLPVLIKVARAMNPRKMSPILAAMNPKPAEQLTTAFASTESADTMVASGENLAALPQIIGH